MRWFYLPKHTFKLKQQLILGQTFDVEEAFGMLCFTVQYYTHRKGYSNCNTTSAVKHILET